MKRDWTTSELQFLKDNYERLPHKTVAQALNRTTHAVRFKAGKYGLTKRESVKKEAGTLQDVIETRYTSVQIRQLYAKLLAGKRKHTPLEDVSSVCKQEAGKADINLCVQELASNWKRFTQSSGS